MKRQSVFTLLLAAFLGSAGLAHASSYTTTLINYPGSQETILNGINDLGQVVGYYTTASDPTERNFIYDNGVFTNFSVPGSTETYATAINDLGQILGYYDTAGARKYFLYANGAFSNINVPDNTITVATINNAGQIAGSYYDSSGSHGFIETNGTLATFSVPNTNSLNVRAMNNAGLVVGEYLNPSDDTLHGYLYSNGVLTMLPSSSAQSINDAGQVLTYLGDLWNSDGTKTTIPPPILPMGVNYYSLFASMNNVGQFIGTYGINEISGDQYLHGFLLTPNSVTPAPEPSSLLLLGCGLSGLVFMARSKRKQLR